ncbi:MAG: murein biosynthesis integral membrane protein MurJ [Coriobacteriales bacterium]
MSERSEFDDRSAEETDGKPSGDIATTQDSEAISSETSSPDKATGRKNSKLGDENPTEDIAKDSEEDTKSVVRSTATMSMATLLSRITGFARTWACAFALGNTLLSSAYQIANNVPNMLYELVAGGILTTAFLPVYVSQLKNRGRDGAGSFASNLMSIGIVVLGVVALLATIFAPQVIATQTFMSGEEDSELAVYFFRFFAIQVVFYGVGAIISGLLNAHKSFLWPALGPVFNNLVVIVTMVSYVFIVQSNPDLAKIVLAVGTSLGVAVMMCVQIPALVKLKIPLRFHINLHDPALKETLRLALPATIFVVVNLIVVSVRNAFSLGVADNGPSTLSYAWLWYQFPYGVLAVALSTAMLTEMSGAAAVKDWPTYRRNVRSGLSGTIFLILPLAALMFCLSDPLVALYHAGQFTAQDVQEVSLILKYWCLSLPFYSGYMYLYRSFSAMQDLGLVTWIDAGGRIVQAILYSVLTMGIGDFAGFGLAGIPISDFLFYFVAFFVLCFIMRKKVGAYGLSQVFSTGIRSLAASAVSAAAVWFLYDAFGSSSSILTALLTIIVLGIVGLVIFYVMSKLMRVKETALIDRGLKKLVGRAGKKN